jgi:hypothetical protein
MKARSIGCLPGCLLVAGSAVLIVVVTIAVYAWRESRPYRGAEIRRLTAQLRQGDQRARLQAVRNLEPIVRHCVGLHFTMNCVTGIVVGKGSAEHAIPLLSEALIVALQDSSPKVRGAAARMLGPDVSYAMPSVGEAVQKIPDFLDRLVEDEEPNVRLAAISLMQIGLFDRERTAMFLATLASDEDAKVRLHALEQLGNQIRQNNLSPEARELARKAVPAILDRLRDDTVGPYWAGDSLACLVLMEAGGPDTLESLLTVMNRPAAPPGENMSLWNVLGPDVDIPLLIGDVSEFDQLLSHEDFRIRTAALRLYVLTAGYRRDTIDALMVGFDDAHWMSAN